MTERTENININVFFSVRVRKRKGRNTEVYTILKVDSKLGTILICLRSLRTLTRQI